LRYLVTIGYRSHHIGRRVLLKIAVVGASGNAGSRIVTELASRGHIVTAIARHPEKITARANITAKQGDAIDQAGLTRLFAGHERT
jgi:hypothetical protein